MSTPTEVKNFHWMLGNFVAKTAGVRGALAVSSDGLLLGASGPIEGNVEQIAALVSALVSLTGGASEMLGWQRVNQLVVEMDGGYLFLCSISDGSALAVLARPDCDMALIAYEMTLMVERMGRALTPALVATLQNTLSV